MTTGLSSMFGLKIDDERRCAIIGIPVPQYSGGTHRYEKLTLAQLDQLLAEGFADPEDAQNEAPTLQEIRDFMARHPDFTAHGYIVAPKRDDYRVTIEGVELERTPTKQELADFTALFRNADDFIANDGGMFCWFD